MAPLLLDKQRVRTIGLLFIITVMLGFAGGYVLGYQQAIKKNPTSLSVSELFIPVEIAEETVLTDKSAHSSNEPGKNVDVDAPDSIANTQQSLALEKSTSKKNTEEKTSTPVEENTPKLEIVDSASKDEAKYSIQVGLYGLKVNAERRVTELINEKLSGHLTNFINGKGDTLYNVRFGYFMNKTSVLDALAIYQKQYTGGGYIVRLKH